MLSVAFFSATARAALPSLGVPVTHNSRAPQREGRVVIDGVSDTLVPSVSTIWQCACDTDGCWPGCFTIASASILDYWSQHGYPAVWDARDVDGGLHRLRDLFPNLFCYDNKDNDGKPGETGYDAFDVARGLDIFVRERGSRFVITPIPSPAFAQITAEIDAGRPVIGAFGTSPWGSHAGTIIGYDTRDGNQIMIVRPNLANKNDTEMTWGKGYGTFGIVTVLPTNQSADLPGVVARDIAIQVDDTEPGFVMRGDWVLSPGAGVNDGARMIASIPADPGGNPPGAEASWMPKLPYDGLYDVQVFLPREDGTEGDSNTHLVTYRINHAEGATYSRRSQHAAGAGWMSLGTFPFVRGEHGDVRITNDSPETQSRSVWADAARFVWRAPLLVQREDGGPIGFVSEGKLHDLRDAETFGVLHMKRADVRALDMVSYLQYAHGDPVPSMFSSWVGQYFDNEHLSPPLNALRGEATLSAVWAGASPFSARWTRTFALTEGDYPFKIEALGGVRVWVDGRMIIDAWDTTSAQLLAYEKTVPVLTGLHRVDVDYVSHDGSGQIRFGNLPPNPPVLMGESAARRDSQTDVTLRWLDAGDPDTLTDSAAIRSFFVTVWRDDGFHLNSGWITGTQWTVALSEDGRYQWSVLATDGTVNSPTSPARSLTLDSTPPWAQMLDVQYPVGRIDPAQQAQNSGLRLVTDANGNQTVVADGVRDAATSASNAPNALAVFNRPLYKQFGNAPVVKLTWWATDTLNAGAMRYILQTREIVQARTSYTLTSDARDVTRLGFELTLSGTQEITHAIVLTERVAYTDVTPIMTMVPVTAAEWITLSGSLPATQTVFVGYPGSTYEFRVRAIDGVGNEQIWHDGYALQARIDEETVLPRGLAPMSLVALTEIQTGTLPAEVAPVVISATAPITGAALLAPAVLTSTYLTPVTDTQAATLTVTATPTPTLALVSIVTAEPTLVVMSTIVGGVPVESQLVPAAPTAPGGLIAMPTIDFTPLPPVPSATPQPPATAIPYSDTP